MLIFILNIRIHGSNKLQHFIKGTVCVTVRQCSELNMADNLLRGLLLQQFFTWLNPAVQHSCAILSKSIKSNMKTRYLWIIQTSLIMRITALSYYLWQHSGVVIGNAASQQEAFKSTGHRKLFNVHILPLPAWVPFRYSNYLPQPKHMHACWVNWW